MSVLLQEGINGLVLGSVYALIALGYSMVYGIVGLINFAHGDVVMVGALSAASCLAALLGLHTPLWLALPLAGLGALVVCMSLGWSIERLAYRPLRRAPRLAPLITAIGVSILLQNLAILIWGRGFIALPVMFSNQPWVWAGIRMTVVQMVILGLCLLLMVALLLLIHRSSFGRMMRAVAQNPEAARLMGIDVDRTIAQAFVLGSALAALAGFMVMADYGQGDASMGFRLGLKAFSAAVLGGIGNIGGAVLGGLLLGVIESVGAAYLAPLSGGVLGSQYEDVFAFIVLIAVLVWRPSGLLGQMQADRA